MSITFFMMRNYILGIIYLCLVSASFAQKKLPEHYIYPFDESYQSLVIRINAILLTRNDGSGNFNLKDAEENNLFKESLEVANYRYSNFERPDSLTGCYVGNDFYKDARIRFVFNIIEVRNSYYWDYLNSGSIPEEKKYGGFTPSDNWYIKPLDDSIAALDIPKAINVYFTENGKVFDELVRTKAETYNVTGNHASQFPSNTKLRRSSQIHFPNVYANYIRQRYHAPKQYNTTWNETKYWWLGNGLAHELGHSFGLAHSNEYHQSNKCIYSMMSQKHDHKRNYLQPTEIKKIHWNLTRTNLMQFVTEESHYGVTWQIDKDTAWNSPRRFYNNFEIEQGITLTISDSIIMPPQSFIRLNKNSKIIFTGKGKILNAFGEEYSNYHTHRTAQIFKQNL